MSHQKTFRELHQSNKMLHLGNVWDFNSALMLQKHGYQALGTSSYAIAKSLGYTDGEEMSFEELFLIVKQIISKVNLPLSVDIEGGYSRDTKTIIEHILRLHEIGVVGINIEDSIIQNGKRTIIPSHIFANMLKEIYQHLSSNNIDIFINARIDTYILEVENSLQNTIKRIKQYENAGADGIFVPAVTNIEEIKQLVQATSLPLNVLAKPNLDDFKTLESVGVKRVSQGPFLYNQLMATFESSIKQIKEDNSYHSLFREV